MFDLPLCQVEVPDTSVLSDEEFALVRRNGIGASDSAAILGAYGTFRTLAQVTAEKLELEYTDAEREVGKKIAVRKGKDLEALILQKAEAQLKLPIVKPNKMYRIIEYPYLTVNFDGLYADLFWQKNIPVEAKYITIQGDKYYDFERAHNNYITVDEPTITAVAKGLGIPSYYLVQIHQQMLATGANHGWLAALREKDWELYLFYVPRLPWLIEDIIVEGARFWRNIENMRKYNS